MLCLLKPNVNARFPVRKAFGHSFSTRFILGLLPANQSKRFEMKHSREIGRPNSVLDQDSAKGVSVIDEISAAPGGSTVIPVSFRSATRLNASVQWLTGSAQKWPAPGGV